MVKSLFIIEPIKATDNAQMANIVRLSLAEYDADRPGFAWQDPELDHLSLAYKAPNQGYWVARDQEGSLLGGCGIGPLAGLGSVVELQKMYLLPEARGQGIGMMLLETALSFAAKHSNWCYLETLGTMSRAAQLYRRAGFMRLPQPLGDSGHGSCDHWYLIELNLNTQ